TFYAVETTGGDLLWQIDTETPVGNQRTGAKDLRSSPQFANGKLYFGNGYYDCSAFCVDAKTGEVLWKTVLDDDVEGNQAHISSSPAYYDGMVFFGTSSGQAHIVCLDAETGAIRWRFRVVPTAVAGGGSVWTSPAIDEEHEIVYNATGSVKQFMPPGSMLYAESILAHDLRSGRLLWYYQVRPADPFDLDFGCHPMLFDAVDPGGRDVRKCVSAGNKAGMFTVDRYTGELVWKVMLTNRSPGGGPHMNSTAVAYNRVYVVSNAYGEKPMSVSAALHAYTGEIEWWVPNDSVHKAPVAVANGIFYQGLTNGKLQALHAENGRILWEHQLPSAHRGGITISNGTLFVSNGEMSMGAAPTTDQYGVYAFTLDGK
ncbi:PQQ-binding-like beta-propeller repeat protein, partial [Acidobacteria bacterium AH-259-D05]|nr:PQQ-binding-like beta-propeller repeat protein [Acidobacteria bacterium AH-259-D05]